MSAALQDRCALVVVDLQNGFDDPRWGERNNPCCEANIEALVDMWAALGRPLVYVRHDSAEADSPLRRGTPGNELSSRLRPRPDLLVSKTVNSAFHGTPSMDQWLRDNSIGQIAICGVTTNHCCETTARVGANLGHEVLFVLDATFTFGRDGPDGGRLSADELTRATAAKLHQEFAEIVSSADLLAGQQASPSQPPSDLTRPA